MHIDKNFVAINFQLGGILIVNLSSRKNFQIEYDVLENQIKLVPIRYSVFLVLSNFSLERNFFGNNCFTNTFPSDDRVWIL